MLLVAGCGLNVGATPHPAARYLHLGLPGVGEPLQVADLTASVIEVELGPAVPLMGANPQTGMGDVPGRPTAKFVAWVGGCEQRVDIAVDPPSEAGADPTIGLKLLPGTVPCPDVQRQVILVFDHSVAMVRYNFDVVK